MATTDDDRLDDILNDTPNRGTQPKKKTSDGTRERTQRKTAKAQGESAGQSQIDELTQRNRQVADQITAFNAKQVATYVVQDYFGGTFMKKTLSEIDQMLEGFRTAFDENLLTLEASEESDPLELPCVCSSPSEPNPTTNPHSSESGSY